ncbi:hemicentin-2-like [Glandiceps talaboti]
MIGRTASSSAVFLLKSTKWIKLWIICLVFQRKVSAIEFDEKPIETIGLLNYRAQLNCSFIDHTIETGSWGYYDDSGIYRIISFGDTLSDPRYSVTGIKNNGEYTYHLEIPSVMLNMEYEYQCSVTGINPLDELVMFHVLENSPKYDILPSNFVVEEDDVAFNCSVEKAVPPGELVWLQDYVVTSSENETVINTWITYFNKYDNGSIINCCLLHETLPPYQERDMNCADDTIMIVQCCILYSDPAVVNITSDNELNTVVEGEDYHAECYIVEDGNPAVITYWYWLGPKDETHNGPYLNLLNVTRDDKGVYTCFAINTYKDGRNGTASASETLYVESYPSVSIFDESGGKVIEGHYYQATCHVDAYPEPDIAWFDPEGSLISTSANLTIYNVGVGDAGQYTCKANNSFSDGSVGYDEDYLFLDVQFLREPTIFDKSDWKVIEGQNYYANCSADANPESDLSWIHSSNIKHSNDIYIEDSSRSNAGTYTCRANTTYWNGKADETNSTLELDVQYYPNVTIEDISGGRVIVGETYEASCMVDSNPVAETQWKDPNDHDISTDPSLLIEDVERKHAGNYECQARNEFWDLSYGYGNASIFLDVQYDPSVMILDVSKGKVIEGDNYWANCTVDSNPEADTVWSDPNGDIISPNETILWLTDVKRDDSGYFTCKANNTFWDSTTGSGDESIFVDVQYAPEISITAEHGTTFVPITVEEDIFYAHCNIDANPLDDLLVLWKYGDKELENEQTLQFKVESRDQAGYYTCYANNTFWEGSQGSDSQSFDLDVQYPPSVDVFADKTILKEGDNTTLFCNAIDGNPTEVNYTWYLHDDTLHNNNIVDLVDIQRSLWGIQVCEATNEYYDGRKGRGQNETYLDVQYSPGVKGVELRCIEGKGVSLDCVYDANPIPHKFEWSLDGNYLSNSPTYIIDEADRSHSGDYNCTASNTFHDDTVGIGHNITNLVVELLPSVNVTEGEDVKIICESVGGVPEPYILELYLDNKFIPADINGTQLEYTVNGIQRSGRAIYDIECRAVTRFYDDSEDATTETDTVLVYHQATIVEDDEKEREITVASSGKVEVWCSADAVPLADIEWFDTSNKTITNENKNLQIAPKEQNGTTVSSKLTIIVADDSYYGTYTCKAHNEISEPDYLQYEIIPTEDDSTTAIIVISCSIAVLIIIIIVLAVLIYRGHKQKKVAEVNGDESTVIPYADDVQMMETGNDRPEPEGHSNIAVENIYADNSTVTTDIDKRASLEVTTKTNQQDESTGEVPLYATHNKKKGLADMTDEATPKTEDVAGEFAFSTDGQEKQVKFQEPEGAKLPASVDGDKVSVSSVKLDEASKPEKKEEDIVYADLDLTRSGKIRRPKGKPVLGEETMYASIDYTKTAAQKK